MNTIKFLDAYSKDDFEVFFGRERETKQLYEMIKKSRLLLLYGLSGTGKTSLIRCGLANRFEPEDWLEIYIRRGTDILQSLEECINDKAIRFIPPGYSLIEALESVYLDHFKPIYLIFDQFEELFISGEKEEIRKFKDFLSKLVNKGSHNVKVLLALREEYIAFLDTFEDQLPQIFNHRLRLERMTYFTLQEVVNKMIKVGDIEIEKEELVDQILDNIKVDNVIELPYLQVYMDKVVKEAKKLYDRCFIDHPLLEKIGQLDDVLGTFLEEQIRKIGYRIEEQNLIYKMLKMMITPDGTKRSVSIIEIEEKLQDGKLRMYLKQLEESRIVRIKGEMVELPHDSLANKIAQTRTEEENRIIESERIIHSKFLSSFGTTEKDYLTESQLLIIDKVYKKLKLTPQLIDFYESSKLNLEKSKKRERNSRFTKKLLISIIIIVLIIGIGISSIFLVVKNDALLKADNLTDSLKATTNNLEVSKKVLENQRKELEDNVSLLRKAQILNDSITKNLETSRTHEIQQRIKAEEQSKISNALKIVADSLRDESVASAVQANTERNKADSLKNVAEISKLASRAQIEHDSIMKLSNAINAFWLFDSLYGSNQWSSEITHALIHSLPDQAIQTVSGIIDPVEEVVKVGDKLFAFTGKGEIIKTSLLSDQPDSVLTISGLHFLPNSTYFRDTLFFSGMNDQQYLLDPNSMSYDEIPNRFPGRSYIFRDRRFIVKGTKIQEIDGGTCKNLNMGVDENKIISKIKLSHDQMYLGVGTSDGWFYLFDLKHCKSIPKVHIFTSNSSISDIAFSESSEFIALSGLDGTIKINKIKDLGIKRDIQLNFNSWVNCLVFVSENKLLLGTQREGLKSLIIDPEVLVQAAQEKLSTLKESAHAK